MPAEQPVLTTNAQRDLQAQIGEAAVVVPNDDTDLPGGVTRAIYVCTEGSLRVTLFDMADDTNVVYSTIHAGRHPMFVKRVWEDTTADIVAEY
jgi:hypothetical protein